MQLLAGRHQLVLPCSPGVAPFLARELDELGLPQLEEKPTTVVSKGDFAAAIKLNLTLRCAQRVLWRLAKFTAATPDELYERLSALTWEEMIPVDGYFSVTSVVDNPTIRDNRFANLKVKDAIVDRLRRLYGRRPDSGPRRDHLVFHLFWQADQASIFLDTSGHTLARRGYRPEAGKAPLRETLAAALVQATGWQGRGNLINPMCGSGTLAIEAALVARGLIPGLLRRRYAFQALPAFPELYEGEMRRFLAEARRATRGRRGFRIIATDHNHKMVKTARANAERAGVAEFIEFKTCDFAETRVPEGGGIIICNPEYGVRLGDEEQLKQTYRRLGDFFKQRAVGYQAFVFSGNRNLLREIGLKPDSRRKFDNGGIDCELSGYPLFAGRSQDQEQDQDQAQNQDSLAREEPA